MNDAYSHLVHIKSHDELALYELIPDVVWIFDLDKHGWWSGNQPALKFWAADEAQSNEVELAPQANSTVFNEQQTIQAAPLNDAQSQSEPTSSDLSTIIMISSATDGHATIPKIFLY